MAKIKFNLNSLSILEKVARGREIVSAVSDTVTFPAPPQPLTQVTALIDKLDKSTADVQASKQQTKLKISIQNEDEEAVNQALSQILSYVESVSGGDEKIIKKATLEVRAARTPSGDISAPTGLNATAGDHTGEIDLSWDKVNNARSYIIERSIDPPTETSWSYTGVSTKSRITVDGLTIGTKFWFRVAAVGVHGQSGWSNPTAKFAS